MTVAILYDIGTKVAFCPHHPGDQWSEHPHYIVGHIVNSSWWREPTVLYQVAREREPHYSYVEQCVSPWQVRLWEDKG